jgi:hypothetical protein
MKRFAGIALGLVFSAAALFVYFQANRAAAQDPNLKPEFGSVKLKAGFLPDPYKKELIAGGPIQTDKGGVKAWVANKPDFQLFYMAGKYPLTIHVESKADTTLLVNLPDGTWVANDDQAADNLNPLLRFAKPQSGRYQIWVGTFNKEEAKATLLITEVK